MYVADEDAVKSPTRVGASRFDECEGCLSVEERVLSKIHPLLTALAKELLDLVAAFGEGRGLFFVGLGVARHLSQRPVGQGAFRVA